MEEVAVDGFLQSMQFSEEPFQKKELEKNKYW